MLTMILTQDEMDALSLIFDIGRNHGSFAISIIKEFFPEVENLVFLQPICYICLSQN